MTFSQVIDIIDSAVILIYIICTFKNDVKGVWNMATQGKVYLQYKGTINTSPSDHVIFNIEEKDPFKNSLIETMGEEKKEKGNVYWTLLFSRRTS